MLEPKEIDVDGKTYIIHKFPAWQGVHLVGRMPLAVDFLNGNLGERESIWSEVFSYIAVPVAKGTPLFLTTQALINNHVKGWPQMLRLFHEISGYNRDFLADGEI